MLRDSEDKTATEGVITDTNSGLLVDYFSFDAVLIFGWKKACMALNTDTGNLTLVLLLWFNEFAGVNAGGSCRMAECRQSSWRMPGMRQRLWWRSRLYFV